MTGGGAKIGYSRLIRQTLFVRLYGKQSILLMTLGEPETERAIAGQTMLVNRGSYKPSTREHHPCRETCCQIGERTHREPLPPGHGAVEPTNEFLFNRRQVN